MKRAKGQRAGDVGASSARAPFLGRHLAAAAAAGTKKVVKRSLWYRLESSRLCRLLCCNQLGVAHLIVRSIDLQTHK